MPTKPSITPNEFCTNTTYVNPSVASLANPTTKLDGGSGFRADGNLPSGSPPAQFYNFEFNVWSQYVVWVSEGTSDPAEDAHIVETDSTGRISGFELTALGGVVDPNVSGAIMADPGTHDAAISTRTSNADQYQYVGEMNSFLSKPVFMGLGTGKTLEPSDSVASVFLAKSNEIGFTALSQGTAPAFIAVQSGTGTGFVFNGAVNAGSNGGVAFQANMSDAPQAHGFEAIGVVDGSGACFKGEVVSNANGVDIGLSDSNGAGVQVQLDASVSASTCNAVRVINDSNADSILVIHNSGGDAIVVERGALTTRLGAENGYSFEIDDGGSPPAAPTPTTGKTGLISRPVGFSTETSLGMRDEAYPVPVTIHGGANKRVYGFHYEGFTSFTGTTPQTFIYPLFEAGCEPIDTTRTCYIRVEGRFDPGNAGTVTSLTFDINNSDLTSETRTFFVPGAQANGTAGGVYTFLAVIPFNVTTAGQRTLDVTVTPDDGGALVFMTVEAFQY